MEVSLIKKIRLFRTFGKTIRKNKTILSNKFNIRIDNANRLYTVLNIPEEIIGEAYSLKKSDIDRISENYTREVTRELAEFLNQEGLQELYEIYEIKKVDKYSYLIVIGFRLFNSAKYYNRLYYVALPITVAISTIISLFLLL